MTTFIETIQSLPVANKRSLVNTLKQLIKEDLLVARSNKELARAEKRVLRENRKADKIAKLEAKLAALKNPVGAKAVKANRKPGKVTTTKFA
jgi:hypothetical protein